MRIHRNITELVGAVTSSTSAIESPARIEQTARPLERIREKLNRRSRARGAKLYKSLPRSRRLIHLTPPPPVRRTKTRPSALASPAHTYTCIYIPLRNLTFDHRMYKLATYIHGDSGAAANGRAQSLFH